MGCATSQDEKRQKEVKQSLLLLLLFFLSFQIIHFCRMNSIESKSLDNLLPFAFYN